MKGILYIYPFHFVGKRNGLAMMGYDWDFMMFDLSVVLLLYYVVVVVVVQWISGKVRLSTLQLEQKITVNGQTLVRLGSEQEFLARIWARPLSLFIHSIPIFYASEQKGNSIFVLYNNTLRTQHCKRKWTTI